MTETYSGGRRRVRQAYDIYRTRVQIELWLRAWDASVMSGCAAPHVVMTVTSANDSSCSRRRRPHCQQHQQPQHPHLSSHGRRAWLASATSLSWHLPADECRKFAAPRTPRARFKGVQTGQLPRASTTKGPPEKKTVKKLLPKET